MNVVLVAGARACRLRRMVPSRTPAEIIASTLIARDGIAAIWGLHLSAALAYQDAHKGKGRGGWGHGDRGRRGARVAAGEWARSRIASLKGSRIALHHDELVRNHRGLPGERSGGSRLADLSTSLH